MLARPILAREPDQLGMKLDCEIHTGTIHVLYSTEHVLYSSLLLDYSTIALTPKVESGAAVIMVLCSQVINY